MKHRGDTKNYSKLYNIYINMSQSKRNIECAHYQYQKDMYPAIGLYISLGVAAVSDILKETGLLLYAIAIFAAMVLYAAFTLKEASMNLSVIKDIEKEETLKK